MGVILRSDGTFGNAFPTNGRKYSKGELNIIVGEDHKTQSVDNGERILIYKTSRLNPSNTIVWKNYDKIVDGDALLIAPEEVPEEL
jgi:hypothetical protein